MMFTKSDVMAVISVAVFFMIASYILRNILCSIYEDLKKKFDKNDKWPDIKVALAVMVFAILIALFIIVLYGVR